MNEGAPSVRQLGTESVPFAPQYERVLEAQRVSVDCNTRPAIRTDLNISDYSPLLHNSELVQLTSTAHAAVVQT